MSKPKDPQKYMQWKKKISESNKMSYLEGKLTGAFKKNSIPWNKGKTEVYSKEILERMSESHKGQIPWNKGKKGIYSKMKIENIGRPFTGRIVKCKICGKPFKASPSRTKAEYCSKKCFIESLKGKIPWNKKIRGYKLHRTGIYKKCKICNKEIYVKPCQRENKKYCSRNCQLID